MKKLFCVVVVIAMQHLSFNIQKTYAQAPFHTPDNVGSGNCLDFNGTSDWVQVPSSTVFDFGTGNYSVSAWIKASSGLYILSRFSRCGSDSGFNMFISGGGTLCGIVGLNGGLCGTNPINDEAWHFVTIVRNGGTLTGYIDGEVEMSRADIADRNASGQNNEVLSIGAHNPYNGGGGCSDPAAEFFDGLIDEVSIWNKALTQTEIRNNMSQQLAGNEAGLVGYWNMNEGSGNTVSDLTTNANHGTRQ